MINGSAAAFGIVLLGLIFGSLATALSYRLPRDLPIGADRSRCTSCNTPLAPRDLLPLVSWMLNAGRCRHCGAQVSWRYPAIEVATGGVFLGAWFAGGGDPVRTCLLALIGFALIVITVTDLEERIIPDAILLFLVPLAVAWRATAVESWIDAGLGVVLGAVISLGLRWAFQRGGRDALGLGDVKFLTVAGLFIGLQDYGLFLVIAGCAGMILGVSWRLAGRGRIFPFGPALCTALAAILAGLGR